MNGRPGRSRASAGGTLCPSISAPGRAQTRARLLSLLLLLAIGVATWAVSAPAAPGGSGGDIPTEVTVSVKAQLSHGKLRAGGEATLALVYDIPPEAHIQVNEFLFAHAVDGQSFAVGEARRSPTVLFEGEPVHSGRMVSWHRVRLARDLAPGGHVLKILAGYQACLETPVFACFAPAEVEIEVPIEVVSAGGEEEKSKSALFAAVPVDLPAVGEPGVAGAPAGGDSAGSPAGGPAAKSVVLPEQTGLAGRLQQAMARRSILAFLIVFLAGIATSFTPCVYPMIPITISYIGGRAKSRAEGFSLSLVFVLGIAVTYSIIGAAAALTGSIIGGLMQSAPVLIGVGAVFFAMGASMLGAFDLALPSGLLTRLQGGPRGGILGALFMGMVTGIVASPCVGPVLAVLVLLVGAIGSLPLGIALFFVFALGLGLLFLVIGTFAGALASLPQAGGWMDTVKHVFGVVMIAMGIYFLRGVLGPGMSLIAFGIFALVVGTFAGAFHALGEDPPKGRLFRKALGIIAALVGGFLLLAGLARYTGFGVPPGERPAATGVPGSVVAGHGNWLGDDISGRAVAKAAGKPALLDFWADWCAACKELDRETWSDPTVQRELERFVAIKLDLTAKNEANSSKLANYGIPGLPTVILFDASGREVTRFFGFKPPREVLELLRSVP